MKRILCLLLCIVTMLALGCNGETQPVQESVPTPETDSDSVTLDPDGGTGSLGDPVFDASPAEEIPVVPITTRPPMEGDVATVQFPNCNTDRIADYSYQSDELRIAVQRYENTSDHLVYYVADIWMRSLNCFRMGFGNGKFNSGRENPEDFATRDNVILGVSGTMNSGLVVHNGKKFKNVQKYTDNKYRSGVCALYQDGTVKMFNLAKKDVFNYKKECTQNGGIWQAFQFGPVLLKDGEIPTGLKQKERHPRIIFGYYEPGHYAVVAVDGRTKESIGMAESEMAELMKALGCKDAINLDGGTSAVMLFMGKTINTPSGVDKDGDGVAGRNIVDMLQFAEFNADGVAPDLSTVQPSRILGE